MNHVSYIGDNRHEYGEIEIEARGTAMRALNRIH